MITVSSMKYHFGRKSKSLALLLLLTILVISIFMAILTVVYATHDCVGDGCRICTMFIGIKSLVEYISITISLAVFVGLFFLASTIIMLFACVRLVSDTPLTIKAKLNN